MAQTILTPTQKHQMMQDEINQLTDQINQAQRKKDVLKQAQNDIARQLLIIELEHEQHLQNNLNSI
ncbi:MAG: hypothetical protein V4613_03645 [Bacteroidota bacterium]